MPKENNPQIEYDIDKDIIDNKLKEFTNNKNVKTGFIIFGIFFLLVIIVGYLILKPTRKELMLEFINDKYEETFVAVEFIEKTDKYKYDTLFAIKEELTKDVKDISSLINNEQIVTVYYDSSAKKEDKYTDNYYGQIIKDTYSKMINSVISAKLTQYKYYLTGYNERFFPNKYTSVDALGEYLEAVGHPMAIGTVYIQIDENLSVDEAKKNVQETLTNLKNMGCPMYLKFVYLNNTTINDLSSNEISIVQGIVAEKEENQPESQTFLIDKDLEITEIEDAIEENNDNVIKEIKLK